MSDSLKDMNNPGLVAVMVANVAVYYALIEHHALASRDWIALASHLDQYAPAALGIALTGVINAQLTSKVKAQIVFMRRENALPGCQAFSHLALGDERIDTDVLAEKFGALPFGPREQNVLWYRLYRNVESDPSVRAVQREFLFARDYSCLALLGGILLSIAALLMSSSVTAIIVFQVVWILQFLLASNAARNRGRRLVTTVLAIKCAES